MVVGLLLISMSKRLNFFRCRKGPMILQAWPLPQWSSRPVDQVRGLGLGLASCPWFRLRTWNYLATVVECSGTVIMLDDHCLLRLSNHQLCLVYIVPEFGFNSIITRANSDTCLIFVSNEVLPFRDQIFGFGLGSCNLDYNSAFIWENFFRRQHSKIKYHTYSGVLLLQLYRSTVCPKQWYARKCNNMCKLSPNKM